MHPDFKCCTLQKKAIFDVLHAAFNVLRNFIISTLEVLRTTSILKRAVKIPFPTQRHSKRCSTAALLSLKNLYLCMYTHMHMYIGGIEERCLKCCAPAPMGSGR